MAQNPPVASYDTPDSTAWGFSNGVKPIPQGNAGGYDGGESPGFYDDRDNMVGGTDTPWTPNYSGYDNAPVMDAGCASLSGILSQNDLA